MFGQLAARIVQFFIAKKWIFFLLFTSICLLLSIGFSKLIVEEDIYSVFPKGQKYKEFSEILKHNNLNKQVVFSIDANEDFDENYDILDGLKETLEGTFGKELTDIQIYRNVDEQALVSYLQSAAVVSLDSSDYSAIEEKVKKENIEIQLAQVANKLKGSASVFTGQFWAKDPLLLLTDKLQAFNTQSDSSNYEVEDGIVFTNKKATIVFFATLTIDSKNTDQLVAFDKKLTDFTSGLKKTQPELNFDYFGTFQIAAANAVQVKNDTFITLIISLSLILLLLIFNYRSILAPLYFILPAAFGILSGVGMVGFIHPEISAISLATAGILLGIVLDYSFHFFTHYKDSGNLIDTVKEISAPMLIGSFTTVAAFAALLFTDSVVLQNFGLIALFTLIGSALFTVLFLPVLVHTFKIKLSNKVKVRAKKKVNRLFLRLGVVAIVAGTLFFLWQGTQMNFDADLNNLSYHPKELKDKEDALTGINPEHQKKIYVFANASSQERAKEINYHLFKALDSKKEELNISELVSIAPYSIPENEIINATNKWQSFWQQQPGTIQKIKIAGLEHDFSENAFQPFYQLVSDSNLGLENGNEIVNELGLSKFYYSDAQNHSYLTSIVVDRANLTECKQLINSVEGTYILDLTSIAEDMLSTVKADFNFLLFFSSLLVFLSLLIVYGRLELALFAFFPMILAWVWILGISQLFGIEFNFVNIIITTFIFGLGDDFSIFITDGLIQKYKTNTDAITSYKSAIVLSGVTTIIGTGVLYFAKHPAIHSIGVISVVGITTILLITLYIQPHIFYWFVTRRTSKGRGPITIFTFIYSCCLFLYFFLGSFLLTIFVVFILVPFPASKKLKKRWLNYFVSKLAKSTIYAGFHIKKKIIDSEKLDYSKPSIIIANHASFLDILVVLMLHPKTIIMVKKWVYNSPVFGLFIRYSGYIFAEEGAEGNLEEIKKRFADGYSLVIFPEGTRSTDGEIHRFHKGAFLLSQELDVDIQPILLIGIHEVNPRNDVMIHRGQIIVKPLDRIKSLPNETYSAFSKRALQLMRLEFTNAKQELAKSKFWLPQIIQNYVLKGPVLEWYVRVKYGMERKNFEFYDEIIADRKVVYDIGCGYGYLSYYLHYRNKNRSIIGLDYDVEKIATAQHAIKRNNHLQFEVADIRTYDFQASDAVFINDVLHYISEEDQWKVLNDISSKLEKNGVIFIRDGVVELQDRLKNTKFTEYLSTKLFKFNKSTNDLEFLSIEKMKTFAAQNNFSFEMIEHSKTTSNVLFILRKLEI